MNDLIEIGFWKDSKNKSLPRNEIEGRPHPCDFVDSLWCSTNAGVVAAVLRYLKSAYLESYELGYSYCRFGDCAAAIETPMVMGACNMTDGVYIWPEGYAHYIVAHHVRPPVQFLAHIMKEMTEAPRYQERVSKIAEFGLLQWDAESRCGIRIPRETLLYLREHTTALTQASMPVD